MFAISYDVLNWLVEDRVIPYRKLTAGMVWGNVLEVGGGTGANLEYFPKNTQLTMLEPDIHMIKKLIARVNSSGKDVQIVKSFGENLPFEDNCFDSVVTTLVLCMVEDVEKVISEIYRVLKPGGKFFFYEHIVAESLRGRMLQHLLDPMWKLATTGCHLKRDILGIIEGTPYTEVEHQTFNLNVGIPITIPNIVGSASK